MDALLEGLTEAQRAAVLHVEGPLLILAGPGSGKTRVITHRIAWMLAQGVAGQQILALTFTNKAADEMRSRVERLAPGQSVWVSTFHRFCARLLRKYAPMVGIEENYTIYDTDDSLQTLRRVLSSLKVDPAQFTPEAIAKVISWAKNNLITADQYPARSDSVLGTTVKHVYPAYQSSLLRSNAVDFDDLLLHVATLLRDNPDVRQSLDERYRFVMVDEYQDTNLAQYAIVRAMSIDHPNLAVTGDPDQSIYGWRGANLNNILEFEKDYPAVRVVRLERNYRSTKRILRVASELIAHNVRRKEKNLFTENGLGRPVRLTIYPTQKDEAEHIAALMAGEIRSGRRRPRDFAVFYRVNALSRALEFALREAGVPYQLINGVEFFQRKEIKDVLAYLHLINNPRDEVALLRVINVPARGIGKTAIQRLTDFALPRGLSLLEAAHRTRQIETIGKRSIGPLEHFAAMADRLIAVAASPIEEILGHVFIETGYQDQLRRSGTEEDNERLANIEELLTVAREFDERHGGQGNLEGFLEETSLVSDTDDWEVERDRVTLMTLHASKGLEFPVVFLVAVEEGLLPHERSRQSAEQLEEERRLMFVGITRAQEELHISLTRERDFRGVRKGTVPSHFLMELPREEMEVEDLDEGQWLDAEPPDIEPVLRRGEAERGEGRGACSGRACPARDDPINDDPEPLPPQPPPSGRRGLLGLPLTTAADLANGGKPAPPVSPDAFQQGMLVLHPHYGLGRIVALSGSSSQRLATIDFASSAGRQRLMLQDSPLRPVSN